MNGKKQDTEGKVEVVLSFIDDPPPNSGSQGAIAIPIKPGYLMLTIFDKKIIQRIHWKVRFDRTDVSGDMIADVQGDLKGV